MCAQARRPPPCLHAAAPPEPWTASCLTRHQTACRPTPTHPHPLLQVMPFIVENISKNTAPADWRLREAATFAYGLILDGPSPAAFMDTVKQALHHLLTAMKVRVPCGPRGAYACARARGCGRVHAGVGMGVGVLVCGCACMHVEVGAWGGVGTHECMHMQPHAPYSCESAVLRRVDCCPHCGLTPCVRCVHASLLSGPCVQSMA